MLHDKPFDDLLAPDALTDIQRDMTWPGELELGTPTFGWTGTCGWVAVEATIRSVTHPELQVAGAPPLQPARPWHFYETNPDSDLKNNVYNYIKELPAEPSPSLLVGWLAHPAEIAKHLSADPAVTVYGTSAADHATGAAAARKLPASSATTITSSRSAIALRYPRGSA